MSAADCSANLDGDTYSAHIALSAVAPTVDRLEEKVRALIEVAENLGFEIVQSSAPAKDGSPVNPVQR